MTAQPTNPQATALSPDIRALLEAIRDAIDLPIPGPADADDRAYHQDLSRRTDIVYTAIRRTLNGRLDLATPGLRDMTARCPITYTMWQAPDATDAEPEPQHEQASDTQQPNSLTAALNLAKSSGLAVVVTVNGTKIKVTYDAKTITWAVITEDLGRHGALRQGEDGKWVATRCRLQARDSYTDPNTGLGWILGDQPGQEAGQ